MKISHSSPYNNKTKGFTLVELLVAMIITMIIIGVLTAMTRVAVTGMKNAQKHTRTTRIAQELTSTIAKDLEGIIVRSDNNFEWVRVAASEATTGPEGTSAQITNPIGISFFSAVTDRYNGEINTAQDLGGDVSLVRYKLQYQDTILGGAGENSFPVFSLYRKRMDPKLAFDSGTLTNTDIGAFTEAVTGGDYLAENIYDFTISFKFEAFNGSGQKIYRRIPIQVNGDIKQLSIKGNGITLNGGDALSFPGIENVSRARLHSADISILVLSDAGMRGISKAKIDSDEKLANYLKKYGKHFSKTVILPRP